jgi:signal peptidase I
MDLKKLKEEDEKNIEKISKKNFLKKFWHLLWKDDSLKGWIFSLAFIFLFIKFIFLPLLTLVTGTALPLAIVESCSMHHQGNFLSDFDNWYSRHEDKYSAFELNQEEFETFDFNQGFSKGDILFITGVKPEKIEIGDVIIFDAGQQHPIIHRVISKEKDSGTGGYLYSTIGDNNNGQLSAEKIIRESQIIGKAQFRIVPYLGWGKLIFFEYLKPEGERSVCYEN